MAFLICFASCNNSAGSGGNPEVVVTYELKGDTIHLYDDGTFIITLKDNAGSISGTYSNLTSSHKLMVGKTIGDIAKSGDILKLSIAADRKVSVAYSDITRYSTGDGVNLTGGTPPNGGQGDADSDTDYSLGDAPNGNRLSEDYFDFKDDCADGIYLECAVPAGTYHSRVYIDGVGHVAEDICIDKNRGYFFYPFLDSDKEYTVRVVFLRDEDQDNEGFVLNYINGDGVIGWFETKVKAGANSIGEVCVKDFGEVKIENNGDLKFSKRPAFKNENLLPENWMINIGLVEGVSWEHERQKIKWRGVIEIPQKELKKAFNLFTTEFTVWKSDDFSKIDFICCRPILYYEYGGKKYRYMWGDGLIEDTPQLKTEAELYTDIDIGNPADVAKIQGTWTLKEEDDLNRKGLYYHWVHNKTLIINGNNVKETESYVNTKLDSSPFSDTDLQVLDYDVNHSELSNDKKTLTEKYEDDEEPLSEYFADYKGNNGYTEHYDLKLFEGGSSLKIIRSGTYSDGKDYEWTDVYHKQ